MQPPREGHTWNALGLAVALHALLAAVLLLDFHRPNTLRAGGAKPPGSVERVAQQPLQAAVPPILRQSSILSAASSVSQLAEGRREISSFVHHMKPRLLRPQRDVPLASHLPTVHRVALVLAAGASEAPSSESNERDHDARVAALQAMTGGSLASNAPRERDSDMATSPGYADKVARRLRDNVVAPFAIQGNPSAIVDVTCAPDGALLAATIRRSSGNPEWDRAVLSAVEKAAPMPVDVNGTTPASFTITFRPKG